MVATSKNVLFPGYNRLLTAGDDHSLYLVDSGFFRSPKSSLRHYYHNYLSSAEIDILFFPILSS